MFAIICLTKSCVIRIISRILQTAAPQSVLRGNKREEKRMKLLHLSDLHIGKRVNGFSMLDDQKYILNEILRIAGEEKPDAVIIAGDVYDKSVPPAEAVGIFDEFLVRLSAMMLQVFIISGNHDSAERLAFGSRLMKESGIHFAPVYNGNVQPYQIRDEYGTADIFLLPFIKPVDVRRFFPEKADEIVSYTDAMRAAIGGMQINPANRSILAAHQFVTGAERSESEEISVGGTDNIDASVFAPFDYVALGHIHRPQNIGTEKIRYCGTPLKYSFSEASHEKSVTVAELGAEGSLTVKTVPLVPLRDMAEIKGSYAEVTARAFYENTSYAEDYVHITLTDEEDIPEAMGRLRAIYHNLMKLDYDNARTRGSVHIDGTDPGSGKSPYELFAEFYELQNNAPMSPEQSELIRNMIDEIWREEEQA